MVQHPRLGFAIPPGVSVELVCDSRDKDLWVR